MARSPSKIIDAKLRVHAAMNGVYARPLEVKPRAERKKKPRKKRTRPAPRPTVAQLRKPVKTDLTLKQKNSLLMELGLLPPPADTVSKPTVRVGPEGGKRPKGAVISDNFNPVKLNENAVFLDKLLKDYEAADCLDGSDEVEDGDTPGLSTLDDLRALYSSMGGQGKLQRMMQKDGNFAMLVKELLKAEIDLMKTRMRNSGKDNGGIKEKVVFVVIKGLESDPVLDEIGNGDVDLIQVREAVDPGVIRKEEAVADERYSDKKPEMLFGGGRDES